MGFDQVTEKFEACQQEIIDGREKVESLTNALQLVQQELAHTKTGRSVGIGSPLVNYRQSRSSRALTPLFSVDPLLRIYPSPRYPSPVTPYVFVISYLLCTPPPPSYPFPLVYAHVYPELAAAETVVKVQSRTERMLHSQGKMLQEEVHTRRDEIATLLGKVSRLHDNECDRIKKSARFVGDIDNNKSQLLDGISMIAFQSKTQSSVLCNGVSEMLTKGKATCSSLKVTIDSRQSTSRQSTTVTNLVCYYY